MALPGVSVLQEIKKQPKLISKRTDKTRERYFVTLKYQIVALACLTVGLAMFDGVIAYSALLGGGVYLLPNGWQAKRHFDGQAGKTAQATLAELYAGQIWKMALAATLFALIFVLVEPLSVFSLFASLILLQMIHLVMQFSGKQFHKPLKREN